MNNKLKDLITLINKYCIQKFVFLFKSKLSLIPLIYLFIIYSLKLLPWNVWNDKSIFILWSGPEYLSEYFQFIFYLSSSFLSAIIIFKNKHKLLSLQNMCWLIFFILTFFICIEEISFLNQMNNNIVQVMREFNTQNEINLHNNKFVQPFLHFAFILLNFFLGFIGWKLFPKIEAIPKKKYALYFLFTCIGYSIIEFQRFINYFSPSFPEILVRQEIFEFLMAMGLFLHSLKMFRYYFRNDCKS